MVASFTQHLPDPAATARLGYALGRLLVPGSVVALMGPLGAGKTHFARAVAQGLGADDRQVTSPTFVLIQEYIGRLPIYHFDAYRLTSPREFAELGVHEYMESDGVCLVEWADRVEGCLPADHLRVTFSVTGQTARRVAVDAAGPRAACILEQLAQGEFPAP